MSHADKYDLSDDERYGERPTDEELATGKLMTELPPLLKKYDELVGAAWTQLNLVYLRLSKAGIESGEIEHSIDVLEVGVVSGDDIRDGLLYEHGIEVS